MRKNRKKQKRDRSGDVAERAVRTALEDKKFLVYPVATEGPHPFDGFIVSTPKSIMGKSDFAIYDAKAKTKLIKYNAVGIDMKDYKIYKKYSELIGRAFFILIADWQEGRIYGNKLRILDEPYTDSKGDVYPFDLPVSATNKEEMRIFSREKMELWGVLDDIDIELLKLNYDSPYERMHREEAEKVQQERTELQKQQEANAVLAKFTEEKEEPEEINPMGIEAHDYGFIEDANE